MQLRINVPEQFNIRVRVGRGVLRVGGNRAKLEGSAHLVSAHGDIDVHKLRKVFQQFFLYSWLLNKFLTCAFAAEVLPSIWKPLMVWLPSAP